MAEVMKKTVPQLSPGRFKLTESVNTIWTAMVEKEHDRETINSPEFWSHAAQRLRPFDKIYVLHDESEYYAELLVTNVNRGYATVVELCYHDLSQREEVEIESELQVMFKGQHLKHCIVRTSDGAIIKQEIAKKKDAETWLEEHLKAQ